MRLTIIPFYAALSGIMLIFLSVRVIRLRRLKQVAVGDNDDLQLRPGRCGPGGIASNTRRWGWYWGTWLNSRVTKPPSCT